MSLGREAVIDLGLERVHSVVRDFVDISFAHAPNIIIHGVVFGAGGGGGADLLKPELGEVGGAPVLGGRMDANKCVKAVD